MSLKSYIFRKRMERHLPKENVPRIRRMRATRAFLRGWWAWSVKPKLQITLMYLKAIERLPFSILFTIYLLFVFVCVALFSQIIYQKWVGDIVNTYPEAVQGSVDPETGRVQLSPLDAIFVPIQAKNQAWYFLMFHVILGMFLTDVWGFYNPRKPQSFHLKGAR